MKVILAGYSKTGTKTMAASFKILGYRTYDFLEHVFYLGDDWNKIYNEGGTADDFRRMYEGVDAVTDTPVFYFWEQLHEAFPDAKIILTLRDEDSWYKSMVKQGEQANNSFVFWMLNILSPTKFRMRRVRYNTLKFMVDVVGWPSPNVHPHSDLVLKRMYREHNNYVQAKAPKDKLLVYRVSEGWEPLCKFLGVDAPNQPFPHRNKKGALLNEFAKTSEIFRRMQREVLAALGFITVFVGVCGYKLFHNWHSFKDTLFIPFEFVKNVLWS